MSNSNMPFRYQRKAVSLTEKGRVANPSRRTERPKVNHGDGSLDPSSGDCDQGNRPHDSDNQYGLSGLSMKGLLI